MLAQKVAHKRNCQLYLPHPDLQVSRTYLRAMQVLPRPLRSQRSAFEDFPHQDGRYYEEDISSKVTENLRK